MSRPERLISEAWRQGLLCLSWFSVCVSTGVWAVVALQHQNLPGGLFLGLLAIIALRLAGWHASERTRLRRLVAQQLKWKLETILRL